MRSCTVRKYCIEELVFIILQRRVRPQGVRTREARVNQVLEFSERDAGFRTTIIGGMPAIAILTFGFLILALVQLTDFTISGKPTRDLVWIIGVTQVAVYAWIRARSRLDLKRQVTVLSIIYGLQLCLYCAVDVDGFMGGGRPILVWRWNSSTGQQWEDYQAPVGCPTEAAGADLNATTIFDSPGFRGADRSGRLAAVQLDLQRAHRPKQLWRQPLGRGWSSFSVVGDFCITQEQRDQYECVVCYELLSGREVWCHKDNACFEEITGGQGPRATPTIHDGKVYALGATGILNCLAGEDGARIWNSNVLVDANSENALFGMSGSPLVIGELVIVCPGGRNASVVAYNANTGNQVWAAGHAGASYSSPQATVIGGRMQILSFNAEGLFSHDSQSGQVLWSFPWVSNPSEKNNVGQPIVFTSPGRQQAEVFISSGYGKGATLLKVSAQAGRFSVREIWRNRNLKAKFSSAVAQQGYIYGLDDRILVCIEVATGRRCWKRGRYGYGQIVLAGETLIVQAESGEIVLVDATPERHHELARFSALRDRTWNHPVLCGDVLLVRNDREAACFRLPRVR